jgi:hypothetical protein
MRALLIQRQMAINVSDLLNLGLPLAKREFGERTLAWSQTGYRFER